MSTLTAPRRQWTPERHSALVRRPARFGAGLAVLALVAVGAFLILPSVRRYIRISTM